MSIAGAPWIDPPRRPNLPPDEIHVWRIELDRTEDATRPLEDLLSPDERARADRFATAALRVRFVVARGLLRRILGTYSATDPARLEFVYGMHGKPELREDAGTTRLPFNLAHSQGLALVAVAGERRVGVDLEAVRPMPDAARIVERFFAARERSDFHATPEPERLVTFFRGWTRKEAFLKATGAGLTMPTDRFTVALAPGEPPRLLDVAGSPHEAARWSLHDLEPAPGFVGALAAEGAGWRFLYYDCKY